MGAVALLPTRATVDAAWERYSALLAPVVDEPRLLLNRDYSERVTLAEIEWKEAFAAWLKHCA